VKKWARFAQLTAVALALVLVVGAGLYGITRRLNSTPSWNEACYMRHAELVRRAELRFAGSSVAPRSSVCDTPHVVLRGLPDLADQGIILTAPRGTPKLTAAGAETVPLEIPSTTTYPRNVTLATARVYGQQSLLGDSEKLVWVVSGAYEPHCAVYPPPCGPTGCAVQFVDANTGETDGAHYVGACVP